MQYSGAVGLGVERSAMFELMLSLMPVCSFYDKVVLAVVGCSGVGALLHCPPFHTGTRDLDTNPVSNPDQLD